jgi:hypothetical protein
VFMTLQLGEWGCSSDVVCERDTVFLYPVLLI